MSRLFSSSVAGSAAAVLIAMSTAAAFAQAAPTGSTSEPKAAQATRSMKPLTPQGPLATGTSPDLKAVQPGTTSTLSTKPLTPQGPLASKPATSAVGPGSNNLATRPLPAATNQAPAVPPPGGKKCGERKGDC